MGTGALTARALQMTCSGCSGAIERVLKKTEGASHAHVAGGCANYARRTPGVSSYDISLEKQEVLVKGTIEYDTLLEKIKKTGKEVRLSLPCSTHTHTPQPVLTRRVASTQVRSGQVLQ